MRRCGPHAVQSWVTLFVCYFLKLFYYIIIIMVSWAIERNTTPPAWYVGQATGFRCIIGLWSFLDYLQNVKSLLNFVLCLFLGFFCCCRWKATEEMSLLFLVMACSSDRAVLLCLERSVYLWLHGNGFNVRSQPGAPPPNTPPTTPHTNKTSFKHRLYPSTRGGARFVQIHLVFEVRSQWASFLRFFISI